VQRRDPVPSAWSGSRRIDSGASNKGSPIDGIMLSSREHLGERAHFRRSARLDDRSGWLFKARENEFSVSSRQFRVRGVLRLASLPPADLICR
jgi:hypothetical protein